MQMYLFILWHSTCFKLKLIARTFFAGSRWRNQNTMFWKESCAQPSWNFNKLLDQGIVEGICAWDFLTVDIRNCFHMHNYICFFLLAFYTCFKLRLIGCNFLCRLQLKNSNNDVLWTNQSSSMMKFPIKCFDKEMFQSK